MDTNKTYKKRTSFWPTIISMSLVLFIIGLIVLISIHTKQLLSHYRNNFEVYVYFTLETTAEQAKASEVEIKKLTFVNSSTFLDKEIVARKEIQSTGNDFIKTLGYNPFPHSLEVHINAEMVDAQTMTNVEKALRKIANVDDVKYAKNEFGKDLLTQINTNFKTVELVLLAIAVILLLIAIALINSTVRLNMFARRFIIKSMQYVGASDWFIIKPFIGMYLTYAIVSSLIAIGLLGSIVYLFEKQMNESNWQLFLPQYGLLAGFLLLLAIVIVLASVFFSTRRYLKLKIDQLY